MLTVNCFQWCDMRPFCSAAAAAAVPPPALLLTNKVLPGMDPKKQFQGLPRTDAISNYFVVMKVCSCHGSVWVCSCLGLLFALMTGL
jgi:hypothetical protein